MKTSATAKFVGTSARKTGLVAQLIRGRRALDAQLILQHTDKRATVPIGKVLASAIANAENNLGARANNLIIESVFIGPGPSLKRVRPRAKGSASAIKKRSSHITVVLTDGQPVAKLTTKGAEEAKAASTKPSEKATDKSAAKATVTKEEAK
jgi:large subunit ribosomal protein L22